MGIAFIYEVVVAVAIVVRGAETITQAGGDGKVTIGLEVNGGGTVDVEALGDRIGTVALHQRVHVLGNEELGNTVDTALFVAEKYLTFVQILLDETGFLTFLIHYRSHGVQLEGTQNGGAVVGAFRNGTGLIVLDLVVGLDFQPRFELPGAVHHTGHTLIDIGVSLEHTVVVQVGTGDVQVTAVVTGAESKVVVVHEGILIGLFHPVGVGLLIPLGIHVVKGEGTLFHIELDVLLGVHHLRSLAQALGRELVRIGDLAVAFTAAGGDHHNTVTGFSTVNSSGSSILQHFHGFDIVRVDTGDGVGETAVHNVQRVGVVVGGDTTDTDGRAATRSCRGSEGLHTGGLTAEGLLRAGNGTVHNVLGLHLRDSAGDV